MSNEYPLYPDLTEEAQQEAEKLILCFKEQLKKAANGVIEECMGQMYTDIMPYIESDTWGNFRQQIVDGLKNYNNRRVQGEWDFKEIRQAIYKEFRDDIIKDLNQDLLKENEQLLQRIATLETYR